MRDEDVTPFAHPGAVVLPGSPAPRRACALAVLAAAALAACSSTDAARKRGSEGPAGPDRPSEACAAPSGAEAPVPTGPIVLGKAAGAEDSPDARARRRVEEDAAAWREKLETASDQQRAGNDELAL
jgi:hypothetical protein